MNDDVTLTQRLFVVTVTIILVSGLIYLLVNP